MILKIPQLQHWSWEVDTTTGIVTEFSASGGYPYDHHSTSLISELDEDHCKYCAYILDYYNKSNITEKGEQVKVSIANRKDSWELYRTALATKGIDRILVYGPPGVGKTHEACMYFKNAGIEYAQVTATEGDMVAEYRGMWVPAGEVFEWFDGLLIRGWTGNDGRGMPIIVNEVDKFPMECMSILHGILDNPNLASLRLPNGKTVQPGPDFRFIGTMNGVPSDLSEALQSRFQVKISIEEPHQEAIEFLDKDVQKIARNLILTNDQLKRVNYRQLLTFKEIRGEVGDETAAQLVFGTQYMEILGVLRIGSDKE